MRGLMFGWEFPPFISGGLGTACFGITKGLTELGHEVIFVLPKVKGRGLSSHVQILSASEVPLASSGLEEGSADVLDVRTIDTLLRPYINEARYEEHLKAIREGRTAYPTGGILEISGDYGPNLVEEITRYGRVAEAIAQHESFDVIHAHDWMTVFAGVRASQVSGKPYIYHVHALEYDRSGENMNRDIFDIEHYGLKSADHIIAVSHYTKKMIVARYGIPPGKITVVYNGVDSYPKRQYKQEKKHPGKVVLFLGRITFQKGPDYFVEAAAKVLEKKSDITFVMAGSGDMLPRMIERVAELGIGKHFHFTGFLHGADVERIYGASDLYVMPSVSEPFGISPLEAAAYEVPVIISKQSGVSEVMNHVLKVDFWDVRELANKILAALTYRALPRQLSEEGIKDLKNLTWGKAARKTLSVYHKVCR